MIELNLYRFQIGTYQGKGKTNRNKSKANSGAGMAGGNFVNHNHSTIRNFGLIAYLYFIITILALTLSMAKSLITSVTVS